MNKIINQLRFESSQAYERERRLYLDGISTGNNNLLKRSKQHRMNGDSLRNRAICIIHSAKITTL